MAKSDSNYNPDNLEAKFKLYLFSNDYSRTSIHNYLTDIRSFLNWFSHHLKAEHLEFDVSHVTDSTLRRYLDYLRSSDTPIASVNRSLSTLRLFGKFLLLNELVSANPSEGVKNIKQSAFGQSLFWFKSNARSFVVFVVGFVSVTLLFFMPNVVSSYLTNFKTQQKELLEDVTTISTNFPNTPASTAAGLMTIPIIDENGALNLTAPYPKIIGQNGTLTIQAPELLLSAIEKGSLTLQTNEGSMHFLFEGEKPTLPFESAFYFSGENLKSGALLYGEVARESDRVSLLELSSGSPSLSKFRVDSEGNVYIKGNVILEGNLIVNPESTIFGTFSGRSATDSASSSL